jgi:hypothetical protein
MKNIIFTIKVGNKKIIIFNDIGKVRGLMEILLKS